MVNGLSLITPKLTHKYSGKLVFLQVPYGYAVNANVVGLL